MFAWIRGLPVALGLITAAQTAATALVIPSELLPSNLRFLVALAPLLVVSCFLFVATSQPLIRKNARLIAALTVLSVLVLVPLHIGYVVETSTGRYLVGHGLTDAGKSAEQVLGTMGDASLIDHAGADRISTLWGASYYVIACVYAYSYLVFCSGVILVLGSTKLGVPKLSARQPQPSSLVV